MGRTDAFKFASIASKSHSVIAAEMADEIRAVIYSHSGKIPLALAVGVLRVVEQEIIDDHKDIDG